MDDIDAGVRRVLHAKGAARPVRRSVRASGADRRARRHRERRANWRARRRGARSCCSPMTARCRSPRPGQASPSSVRWPMRRREMRGPWAAAGDRDDAVTILEGLAPPCRRCAIVFAAGRRRSTGDDASGIAAALESARDADVIVLCVGEAAAMSGEAASRARSSVCRAGSEALAEARARASASRSSRSCRPAGR